MLNETRKIKSRYVPRESYIKTGRRPMEECTLPEAIGVNMRSLVFDKLWIWPPTIRLGEVNYKGGFRIEED